MGREQTLSGVVGNSAHISLSLVKSLLLLCWTFSFNSTTGRLLLNRNDHCITGSSRSQSLFSLSQPGSGCWLLSHPLLSGRCLCLGRCGRGCPEEVSGGLPMGSHWLSLGISHSHSRCLIGYILWIGPRVFRSWIYLLPLCCSCKSFISHSLEMTWPLLEELYRLGQCCSCFLLSFFSYLKLLF